MLRTRFSYWLRRAAWFVRDYWDEFPVVWSLTRTHDCERWGGHYWGPTAWDASLVSFGKTCSGCGTWQSVEPAQRSIPVYPNTTTTGSVMGFAFEAKGDSGE